jgi:hypothetical protein
VTSEVQVQAKRAAVEAANERMRSEVLPTLELSQEVAGVLATGWNPYMVDPSDGFEVTLRTADALVLAVMKDDALLARAKAIMRDEMRRAIFEDERTAPALLGAALGDLLQPTKASVFVAERTP